MSITSGQENLFVEDLIDEIIHIGLQDSSTEGNFEWSDNSDYNYSNFSDCIFCPSNSQENDFVNMNFWDGTWNVEGPITERRFLMELTCNPQEEDIIQPRLIQKEEPFADIRLFPNPTNGNVQVNLYSKIEKLIVVKIYDGRGVEIDEYAFEVLTGANQLELELSNYASGFYFVNLENTNIKVIRR